MFPFILAIVTIVIYGYEYGPDPGFTGAPGDNPNGCMYSGCHTDKPNTGPGSVKIVASGGSTYTPGQMQQIQVTITDSTKRKYGFELTARVDSNPTVMSAGTLAPASDGYTQVTDCSTPGVVPYPGVCVSGHTLQWIEHNLTGYTKSGAPSTTYTFNWTPPAANVGTITLYAAGTAGSGALVVTATDEYMSSLQLSPSGVLLPMLSVTPSAVQFGYASQLITGPQTVNLNFNPPGPINWTASSNQSNIIVTPTFGTGAAVLQITANPGPSGVVTVIAPGTVNSQQQIQVSVNSVPAALPFGSFDTPLNNAIGIAGAIPVTGWALDNVEIASVGIYREAIGNELTQPNGLVYIGSGTFVVGSRPDVQTTFPNSPWNYRAGWGYMLLTNFLPNSNGLPGRGNGTYKLHAIATNKAGTAVDLGTRIITVDNAHALKPFGTIDTPDQGATASGSAYLNFGWALTQNPYTIPLDGSTLTVYVDSLPVGHPTYNQYRSDIATLFPGLANSNGAVGFFYIDTTKLANGVHTIAWTVSDNANRSDGIGSRYFTVVNTQTGNAPAAEEPIQPPPGEVVILHRGYDPHRRSDVLTPDENGEYIIDTEELERIQLRLGVATGYLLLDGERRDLPVGSTLNAGVFSWIVSPGFLGDFHLELMRQDGTAIKLRVRIQPKRYSRR